MADGVWQSVDITSLAVNEVFDKEFCNTLVNDTGFSDPISNSAWQFPRCFKPWVSKMLPVDQVWFTAWVCKCSFIGSVSC
jgi:hypothetical protein